MTTGNKIFWYASGLFVALLPAYLYAHIAGPDPRYTGAPGDNPLACSNSTCHTSRLAGGPINQGGGAVSANFSGGCSYTPGVPQTITVNVPDPTNNHFGFQMTARLESDLKNGQAGDFTAGANQIVLCDDGSFKGKKGCPVSAPVQFIEHSFMQDPVSTTPYTFTWTPPSDNVGPIHFYIAGNAVNNNNDADGGDHVYTNSYVLTPANSATPVPTVAAGGVTNAASFAKDTDGKGSAVAPGSLITIFGTNVAAAGADASGIPLGSCLGGTSVSINGIVTPVRDAQPAGAFPFINAELPADVLQGKSSGSVPVVITVNGVSSTPQSIPVVASAPGFFTIPPGVGNAVLVFVDPADKIAKIAAPTSASAAIGYPTAPIPRGQSGFFYATGLGAMTPPVLDGNGGFEAPLVAHVANATPAILIGSLKVKPDFAGASGYPGVNQINITIPSNAPTGDAIQVQIQSADGTVTSPAKISTIAIR